MQQGEATRFAVPSPMAAYALRQPGHIQALTPYQGYPSTQTSYQLASSPTQFQYSGPSDFGPTGYQPGAPVTRVSLCLLPTGQIPATQSYFPSLNLVEVSQSES